MKNNKIDFNYIEQPKPNRESVLVVSDNDMKDQDGFTELAKMLHEQLRLSGISNKYEVEYRKILGYVLNSFKLPISINSIDDYLFTLIDTYKEPSRTKALWIFSLIDDYRRKAITEKVMLPFFCNPCSKYYYLDLEKMVYCCPCCGEVLKARSEDYWLVRRN